MAAKKDFEMFDKFTVEQCREYQEFCKKHGIIHVNIPSYYAGLVQYFKKD